MKPGTERLGVPRAEHPASQHGQAERSRLNRGLVSSGQTPRPPGGWLHPAEPNAPKTHAQAEEAGSPRPRAETTPTPRGGCHRPRAAGDRGSETLVPSTPAPTHHVSWGPQDHGPALTSPPAQHFSH